MPDPNATKKLSPVIGKEFWLHPDYTCVKFMGTGETYVTVQNPKGAFLTIKPIKETGVHEQIQLHLRIPTKDKGLLDVDIYLPLEKWAEYLNKSKEEK